MKAISVQQPWAYAILQLDKDVENRSWPTYHRGRIAIHASKKIDHEAIEMLRGEGFEIPDDLPTGAFVGEVDLTGCHPCLDDPECCGSGWGNLRSFHHQLANPSAYDEPIPGRGQLGYFEWEGPTRGG